MNVQKIIENYSKLDKFVRSFTFAFIVFSAAVNVSELNEPLLYTYDTEYGIDAIINHGVFGIMGVGMFLPVVFLMPFDRFKTLSDLFKMPLYAIVAYISLSFIIGDAIHFDDFGYAIDNAAFMNQYLEVIFYFFMLGCVVIPIVLHQMQLYSKEWVCHTKT